MALVSACAEDDAVSHHALQRRVDAIFDTGVVGVQAAVRIEGERFWAGAGVARIAGRVPLDPTSQFRIASTTKTFVAATALQLVDRGILSLEDSVERWLPGVVSESGNDGRAITLRHLLQHTSGIANYIDDQFALLQAAQSDRETREILSRTWTSHELIALAMRHPPAFAAGSGWSYTNTGYVLVGQIIAAATGETWEQRVQRQIIEPLGLTRTFAPGTALDLPPHCMRGYSRLLGGQNDTDVTLINPSALDAAGALVSTPSDLAHFFAELLAGNVLEDAALRAMKGTDGTDATKEAAAHYGLGIAWTPSSCGGRWGHDGDTLGFHARVAVSSDGSRSAALAISGDAEFEHAVTALFDDVLCGF